MRTERWLSLVVVLAMAGLVFGCGDDADNSANDLNPSELPTPTRSQALADTDFDTSATTASHVRDDTYDGWVFYNFEKPARYQGMRVNNVDELLPSESTILPDGSTDVGQFRFGYGQSELTLTRAFPGVSVGSQIKITWIAKGESNTSANHFEVRVDQGGGFKTLFGSKAKGWISGSVKFEATASLIEVQFAGQITEDSRDILLRVTVDDRGASANP
jgi:hypothetical protein